MDLDWKPSGTKVIIDTFILFSVGCDVLRVLWFSLKFVNIKGILWILIPECDYLKTPVPRFSYSIFILLGWLNVLNSNESVTHVNTGMYWLPYRGYCDYLGQGRLWYGYFRDTKDILQSLNLYIVNSSHLTW